MKRTHSILSYLKTLLVIASSLSLLVACAAPRTTVQTDGQNGSILLKVTPSSASVDVDGQGQQRGIKGDSR
jgi:uncharacterized lipoprotein YajG